MSDDRRTLGEEKHSIDFRACQEIVWLQAWEDKIPVHKHLICRSSKFFARAFAGSSTQRFQYHNGNGPDLDVYLNWLYSDEVRVLSSTENRQAYVDDPSEYHDDPRQYQLLASLYKLGVLVDDRIFRNAVVTALLQVARERQSAGDDYLPDEEDAEAISESNRNYESVHSQVDSCFHDALVEILIREPKSAKVEDILGSKDLPKATLKSVVRRLMELRSPEPKTLQDVNICEFHELGEGQRQCDHREPAGRRYFVD